MQAKLGTVYHEGMLDLSSARKPTPVAASCELEGYVLQITMKGRRTKVLDLRHLAVEFPGHKPLAEQLHAVVAGTGC